MTRIIQIGSYRALYLTLRHLKYSLKAFLFVQASSQLPYNHYHSRYPHSNAMTLKSRCWATILMNYFTPTKILLFQRHWKITVLVFWRPSEVSALIYWGVVSQIVIKVFNLDQSIYQTSAIVTPQWELILKKGARDVISIVRRKQKNTVSKIKQICYLRSCKWMKSTWTFSNNTHVPGKKIYLFINSDEQTDFRN